MQGDLEEVFTQKEMDQEDSLHSHIWNQTLLEKSAPNDDVGRFTMAFSHKNANGSSAVYFEGLTRFYAEAYDALIRVRSDCTNEQLQNPVKRGIYCAR